jgi:chromosome segregation protein
MSSLKGRLELAEAALVEKIKNNRYRSASNDQEIGSFQAAIETARKSGETLSGTLQSDSTLLQTTVQLLSELAEKKQLLEREVANSAALYAKAEKLATKFEERASVAKNAMNEDLAIAELMKDGENFGILGLVHDLVKWDANYERAVLAAGSEWMKAFVVRDIQAMILMASYAKERRLPRLRIIPLDVLTRYKTKSEMPRDDVNIIGRLSDFVYSDYNRNLPLLLFSETILTRNSSSAYMLARLGYRAVSVEGELFEPSGGSMSLDFGSRISDLTKAILLGDSVGDLKEMLFRLSKTIESKSHEIGEIADRIVASESDKVRLELGIGNLKNRIESENEAVESRQKSASAMIESRNALQAEYKEYELEHGRLKRRLELLEPSTSRLTEKIQSIGDEDSGRRELAEKNLQRSQINKSLDSANFGLSQASTALGGIEGRLELDLRQLREIDDEKHRLELELEHRRTQIQELRAKSQTLESDLKGLRDQEQQVIDSSGNSYTVLQEYEKKIRSLSDSERRLSREHNMLERESALLRKDITDLTSNESRLTNDLVWLGYKTLLDEMDVQTAIRELSVEYEEVKLKINLRADESYVQVMDGYRGMSGRKNQLETERNSIVSFIQHIEKEKKHVFMEAYQRVDSDIRTTFGKMTGGEARLEIENPEDIFASGVMLLVRFPNKTVSRESTALSGGEKTIAATVFLLALQSLKPSPFYLMDEVDAHLDAQNTERLSRVLLERSKDNQIIMVTLKDSTVAKAALIYGVYPREGASQVVKYKNPAQVPLAQIAASEGKQ